MPRVKRGTVVNRRHKKLLSQTKGYKHGRKNLFRQAKQALLKAKAYSYRDRRVKKRTFRSLWIIRLNAAARAHGITYREFIYGLNKAEIKMNRKVLAHIAMTEPQTFEKIVSQVKTALAK